MSAYCTAQDVIDYCSWPAFGRVRADVQDGFIEAASGEIDRYCGRPLGLSERSASESFDGGGRDLWLSLRPVKSIMAVTIDGAALDNTNGDAWTLDPESGRLSRGAGRNDPRFDRGWPPGSGNIVVQYWGGYSADDAPAQLRMAAAFMVRHLVEAGRISGLYQSERIGDYDATLAASAGAGLPSHVAGRLASLFPTEPFA
jgi:hypothetical protein